MKMKDAAKLVEKHATAKELVKKGYFLNCCMSILNQSMKAEKWILTYYNLDEDLVVEVIVNGGVEFKPPAKPMSPTKKKLVVSKIKTSPENMLKKAIAEFNKFKQPVSQVIQSVQSDGEGGKATWRFSFITKLLEVIAVRIDAETGGILSTDRSSLSR